MAQYYCKNPTNTLVISPANHERSQLNSLIHQQLQREGKVSPDDYQMTVYVNRQDMTGTERTFANSYRPNEDIIRYTPPSKFYRGKVGNTQRLPLPITRRTRSRFGFLMAALLLTIQRA